MLRCSSSLARGRLINELTLGSNRLAHVQGAGCVLLQKVPDSFEVAQAGDFGPSPVLLDSQRLVRFKLADQNRRVSSQNDLLPPFPSRQLDRLGENGKGPGVKRRL